ncbi:MAG: hypothetical protein MAG715_00407 [Methanonatronarchaeales archaeon]|nr:hypothetical protein [Methanonatronarchaeales archaeon]
MPLGKVEYEPRSLKELLTEMKDTSELMLDLAYSAILFNSPEIAEEVWELEGEIDELIYHVRMAAMLGVRNIDDAESMSGVLQIAEAAEKVTNAAGDIAKILLTDIGLPGTMRASLPEARETTTRARVSEGSGMVGETLGSLRLESNTGLRVIAIRRDAGRVFNPDRHTEIEAGDYLLCRGSEDGVPILTEMATGHPVDVEEAPDAHIPDLEHAVNMVLDMKNLSELGVGLAYSSILFNSEDLAREVVKIEGRMDFMQTQLELWVLRAAQKGGDEGKLRGLLHLSQSSETISDAAREMSEVVNREIETHPVLGLMIQESEEVLTSFEVGEESPLANRSLGELSLETETGMFVMAVEREGRWIYSPSSSTVLREGDVLIARGSRGSESRLRKLASPPG